MFVRYSTHRVKGKTYSYPQLVDSYRKPDGTPAHRVLCTLSSLSEAALANLATALDAGRKGQRVVVAPDAADVLHSVGVMANLCYLDIAVAYEQWHQLQLDSLLAELLADSKADVPPQDVVCALVMHRCTDPASKAAAARWYAKTALPEIQGIARARFHNTRVHRTLDALERVEAELQDRLARHLRADQGAFAGLFMDITDTWFEGRGPQMAHNARTKEGMLRKKIGVLLLCDQRGYPLRWQTLPGDCYEAEAMGRLVEQIAPLDWVHQVPIVLDRMMGKAGVLARLSDSGLRFVTALPATEFESWTQDIPWQPLAEVTIAGTDASAKEDLARVQAALKRTDMVKVRADRWLLDLGVVTRPELGAQATALDESGTLAEALRLAASAKADLDAGVARSQAELAKRKGVSTKSITRYLKLVELTAEIQQRVLAGDAESLTLKQLVSISRRPAQQQRATFEAMLKKTRQGKTGRRPSLAKSPGTTGPGVSIRLVVGFNPEAFINERTKTLETRREVDAFVEDLNRRLRSPYSHRTQISIHAEVDRYLRGKKWVGLFEIIVEGQTTGDFQVKLVLDEALWEKRMRYIGFNVFAGHPDITKSAADLVEIYFAKDAVEKDFQTIKSEIELRPVRHRTDPKVRAHVTLCMLALLVERQIEVRLREAGRPMTAPALFDVLQPVHLNRMRIGPNTFHTVTDRESDATDLVTALGVQHLVDDALVSQRIQAGTSSVS